MTEPSPADPALLTAIERFASSPCSWFSSVRQDGRPHCVPVWHVWHEGRAYVVTQQSSVKTTNVLLHPDVVLAHQDPLSPVILEGQAAQAPGLLTQLRPLFKSKYDWDIATDDSYDTIIEITPSKLMTWGSHGEGRWTGSQVLAMYQVPSVLTPGS